MTSLYESVVPPSEKCINYVKSVEDSRTEEKVLSPESEIDRMFLFTGYGFLFSFLAVLFSSYYCYLSLMLFLVLVFFKGPLQVEII